MPTKCSPVRYFSMCSWGAARLERSLLKRFLEHLSCEVYCGGPVLSGKPMIHMAMRCSDASC